MEPLWWNPNGSKLTDEEEVERAQENERMTRFLAEMEREYYVHPFVD